MYVLKQNSKARKKMSTICVHRKLIKSYSLEKTKLINIYFPENVAFKLLNMIYFYFQFLINFLYLSFYAWRQNISRSKTLLIG